MNWALREILQLPGDSSCVDAESVGEVSLCDRDSLCEGSDEAT